jgi:hypothetical protein
MVLVWLLWDFDMKLAVESGGWGEKQTYSIVWNRGPLYVHLVPRTEQPLEVGGRTGYEHRQR